MKTKHTPGPWLVTESSDWTGVSGVSLGIDDAFGQDGGRDYFLATVVNGDPDELQANARLIAAAPQMLKTLQRAAHLLAELPNQTPQMLALRSEIVAAISDAAPEYYGLK
jgi:hypothetical protein